MTIAVLGANSSVGLNLLAHVAATDDLDVIAGVRSERAAASLPSSPRVTPRVISYDDLDGLTRDLQSILDHVALLDELDVEGVEPTATVAAAAGSGGS